MLTQVLHPLFAGKESTDQASSTSCRLFSSFNRLTHDFIRRYHQYVGTLRREGGLGRDPTRETLKQAEVTGTLRDYQPQRYGRLQDEERVHVPREIRTDVPHGE